LVDDQILFRKGLSALLSLREDMEVVGEAGDGFEALARARETNPEVILMDISMPRCGGLEAVALIKAEMPAIKIIMLTVSDDDQGIFTAIRNGAEGYILKDLDARRLFDYLEGVRNGEAAIAGRLAARVLREFRLLGVRAARPEVVSDGLTARELEILEQLAAGASNRDIAAALCLSENTVKKHVHAVLDKLHLRNRSQAAAFAARLGIGGTPPAVQ
jgi:DNA-binding NarL/FixJ family response regulator